MLYFVFLVWFSYYFGWLFYVYKKQFQPYLKQMQNIVTAPPAGHSRSAKAALAKPLYIYIYIYKALQVIFV